MSRRGRVGRRGEGANGKGEDEGGAKVAVVALLVVGRHLLWGVFGVELGEVSIKAVISS